MKLKLGVVLLLLVMVVAGCGAKKNSYDEQGAEGTVGNPNGITIEGTILKVVETSSSQKLLVAEGEVKDKADYGKSPIALVQESKYSNLYWVKVESIEGFEAGQQVTVYTKDKPSGNALPYQTEADSVNVK